MESMGNLWEERSLSIKLWYSFSGKGISPILECAYEIQMNPRPEMYVTICSEGQAALQAILTYLLHGAESLSS